jgi:thiol-disulfide isomerase/thioredoxin
MQQLHAQRVKFDLQPVKITVNIKNPRDREIVIQTSPISLAPRASKSKQIKVVLDKENTGSVDILLKGPAMIKIMNVWNDSSLDYLVLPGTNFKLDLDTEKKDFAIYDVSWKNENDFFNSMLDEATSRLKAIPQEDPVVFMEQWQKENDYNHLLLKKAGEQSISKQYAGWVLQNIQSLSYSLLTRQFCNYVTINEKWPSNVEAYFKSCETLSNIQLNDAGYFTSSTDDEFVAQYYLFAAAREYYQKDKNYPPSLEKMYKTALVNAYKIKAPGIKKIMMQFLVGSVVKNTNDTSFLNWLHSSLGTEPGNQHYVSQADDRLSNLRMSPVGKPALIFEAQDNTGEPFSLKAYEGKYVYIDVWATWCVPCRLQIPYLEELKKKYEGKPIAFISVSTDKAKGLWEKFLIENNSGAQQYISAAGLKNGIMNTYQVKYIPRFLLIDKEGNMINTNTYIPSDPALNMLLKKILN